MTFRTRSSKGLELSCGSNDFTPSHLCLNLGHGRWLHVSARFRNDRVDGSCTITMTEQSKQVPLFYLIDDAGNDIHIDLSTPVFTA
jgi:hypothetical protein